jgi:hypothetical protein
MAAVFAIALDVFPLDDNDKLPLGYFLKYLCTMNFPYPPPQPPSINRQKRRRKTKTPLSQLQPAAR